MRRYYYCMDNGLVYTQKEKEHSQFGPDRFIFLGLHSNRKTAEVFADDKLFPDFPLAISGRRI